MVRIALEPRTEEYELLGRLRSLRRVIRRRLVLYGVCAVAAGGIVSLLTCVILDYLFVLPAVLRLVGGGLFFAGFVAATMHWIVKPLRSALDLPALAGHLESRFLVLNDRLSSSVNFLTQSEGRPQGMVRRVVEETDEALRSMPLESVLTPRPLLRQAASLLAAGLVVSWVLSAAPYWLQTGLYRYLDPFGEIEWPKVVALRPLTGNRTVAVGDAVTLRAAVDRGLSDSLRAVVYLRDAQGQVVVQAMQREGDNVFASRVDAITRDLTYWFEAGDADTRRRSSTIRVAQRPEVVDALALIEAPPYAPASEPRIHDLRQGPAKAPQGGFVTVAVTAAKPVAEDMQRYPSGLRTADGSLLDFQTVSADRTELALRAEVTGDLSFRVELRDDFGFSNHDGEAYDIRAVADRAPNIVWTQPGGNVDVVPHATVNLGARIDDDFGVRRVALLVERSSGDGTMIPIELTPFARPEVSTDGVQQSVQYEWALKAMALSAGESLRCEITAWDNDPVADPDGKTGRSVPLYIRVISDAEFEARVREEIVQVEETLRKLVLEQAQNESATRAVAESVGADELSPAQREAARGLGRRESRLARRAREIARRLEGLNRRMAASQTADPAMSAGLANASRKLDAVESGSMSAAAQALSEASQEVSKEVPKNALARSADQQAEARAGIEEVLSQLGEWGDFQTLVSRTRGLIDRQDHLRRETTSLGDDTLGKRPEELPAEARQALDRLAREQESMGDDLDRLLKRMQEIGQEMAESDPGAGAAIDDADRAARSERLAERIGKASRALKENRTASAALDQKSAADVLRRMVDALESRNERELEYLRKEARRAEDELREMIEQQRDLRRATHEAESLSDDGAHVPDLANDQRRLRRNTEQLAREFEALQALAGVADRVADAVAPMSDAEARLDELRVADAPPAQDRAINVLEEALALTEEVARQAEQSLLQKYLDEIRDDLERIAASQREVHGQAETLVRTVTESKSVSRRESRDAARLAREESDIEALISTVLPDLEKVAVYHWAMERVAGWVRHCRERLEGRRLDEELLETSNRILRELERLLAAIDQTKRMTSDEKFAEAEGGGGGQGGPSASGKPIPTVAELLVLRAMQADVNERTHSMQAELGDGQPSERLLRQVRTLGEDQAQVRALAERLTQQAQR